MNRSSRRNRSTKAKAENGRNWSASKNGVGHGVTIATPDEDGFEV